MKVIRFLPYRISIAPYTKFYIEHGNELKSPQKFLIFEKQLCKKKRFELKGDPKFNEVVFCQLKSDKNNRLYQGKLGLKTMLAVNEMTDDDFEEKFVDDYPNINFIWSFDRQVIFFPKNTIGILKISITSLIKKIEYALNDFFDDMHINILPINEKQEFWDTIKSMKQVDWIKFTLIPPNLWSDSPDKIGEFTQSMQKDLNASSTAVCIENKQKGLVVKEDNKFVKNMLNESLRYGGGHVIKGDGRIVYSNKKMPVEFDTKGKDADSFDASDIIEAFNEFDRKTFDKQD